MNKSKYEIESKKQTDFQARVNSIESYVSSCAKNILTLAIKTEGLNENKINNYINNNLRTCVNPSLFEGLEISIGDVTSDVVITNKSVKTNIIFPIDINSGSSTKKIQHFTTSFSLFVDTPLAIDSSGTVISDSMLASTDGRLRLSVPQNTILNLEGNLVDSISITIKDYSMNPSLSYDLKPDNLQFSESVMLEFNYLDENSDGLIDNYNIPEDKIHIGYYDEDTSSWIYFPTIVDKETKKCYSNISHFTQFSLGVPPMIELKASNPLSINRDHEIIRSNIQLGDGMFHKDNIDYLIILDSEGNHIYVSGIASTIEEYPSGFIKSFDIIFQDFFNAFEIKDYSLIFNYESNSNIGDMSIELVDTPSKSYKLNNGHVEYIVENVYKNMLNNYAALAVGDGHWKFEALSSIGDNKVPNNDDDFRISIGLPTDVIVSTNQLMSTISLFYQNPIITGGNVGDPKEFLEASTTITLFNNNPRVFIDSVYHIKKSFDNHNGFMNGAVEGFENGIILGTEEPIWINQGYKPFMGFVNLPEKSIDGNLVPVLYEVTSEELDLFDKIGAWLSGDCELKIKIAKKIKKNSNKFNDYYVIESNGKGVLFYIPDYQKTISSTQFKETYFDQCGAEIPRNQLTKLDTVFYQILSSSGPGSGWIRLNIPEGKYESKTIIIPDLPFGDEYRDYYNNEIELLKNSIIVEQLNN